MAKKAENINTENINTESINTENINAEPVEQEKRKKRSVPKNLPSALERARMAAKIISDDKGVDIKILDLRGITQAFDFFVIASGTSRRQLHAISEDIDNLFEKELGDSRRSICGYQESLWIVLDYDDVVIHLFEPEKRDFYALEELWGRGIDVPLEG